MAKFTEDDFNAGFEKIAEDCYDIRADMLRATSPSLEKEAQRGLGGPGLGGGPYAAGPGGTCLSGDTKIPLLNGKDVPISELVKLSEFWVYASTVKGEIRPAKAFATLTKQNAQVLKVMLDNGEEVKCTPDHLFMVKAGSFKKASALTPDDSLMALYRSMSPETFKLPGYTMVYDHEKKHWVMVHQMVRDHVLGGGKNGHVTHHRDFNKYNNSPENLEIMLFEKHSDLHRARIGKLNALPAFKKLQAQGKKEKREKFPEKYEQMCREISEARKRNWQDAEYREKQYQTHWGKEAFREKWILRARKHAKKLNAAPTEAMKKQRHKFMQLGQQWIRDHRDIKSAEASAYMNRKDEKICPDCGKAFAKNASYAAHRGHCLRNQVVMNHKIIGIEYLTKREDVYDLTVSDYHNFAISAGVFVHNCSCPKCGHKESRGAGVPCREKKCPKCGALMSREGYEKPKTAAAKTSSLSLSDMMKIAQPYGQMARQAPRMPEPSAGFSVKHPTAVTTGATAAGMGVGAGIGYGAGKAIDMLAGASGAGKAGAIAGGAVGALLGAAVGSSEAEKQEEAFSHQLVNYLMKQGAEKPKSWIRRHPILTGTGTGAAALGTAATLLGGHRVGKSLKPILSSKTLSAADKAFWKRQGRVATGMLGGIGAGAGAGLGAVGGGIASVVGKKEKTSAEKPKPKKPSKIQYIYGKTPESVRSLETSEAAGKRIGTGVGKMMARATAPVRAATWLPRKLLFPKELKEIRESGKTMASAGGAAGGALGRLAGRLGGAKSESVPYVGPARTLALARAAGAKTMQKGLPSLPSVVESPTVVVKKK